MKKLTKENLITRRAFSCGSLALGATATAGLLPKRASAASISEPFYLQHAGGMLIHPGGGTPSNGTRVVTHPGQGESVKFHFEFKEGPFGYIVSHANPQFCIHPKGGVLDPGDGTDLVFHEGRGVPAYFALNQKTGTVTHRNGRIWHPYGGRAAKDNNVVIHSGRGLTARFYPTQGDATKPFRVELPLTKVGVEWEQVFADDNPRIDRVHTYKKRIGHTITDTTTVSNEVTASLEMEGTLFGSGTTASSSVTNLFEEEKSVTWDKAVEVEDVYHVKAGEPVAVWQRVFRARFADGTVYNYFSANVTWDTSGSHERPPPEG